MSSYKNPQRIAEYIYLWITFLLLFLNDMVERELFFQLQKNIFLNLDQTNSHRVFCTRDKDILSSIVCCDAVNNLV